MISSPIKPHGDDWQQFKIGIREIGARLALEEIALNVEDRLHCSHNVVEDYLWHQKVRRPTETPR